MKRRLLNLLTVLSLLLCVAVSTAWVASYVSARTFEWGDGRQSVGYMLILSQGSVTFRMDSNVRPIILRESNGFSETFEQVVRYFDECLGVQVTCWDAERSTEPGVSYGQCLQVWSMFRLPFLLTMLLPAWWIVRWRLARGWRRRTRRRNNLCARCGYDLRASPHRCPECGHPPTARGA